ncbi:hypothetical protein [Saccharothrix deserti]|uniref:hypothetical protein n=1 Tax=Saccharothrix deserti TaxID=2593674 RepID=UPI00131B2079|nr:hypothetical protein [Saccharothrix deserti]
MTEPVPGQTPEPAVADAATATPPADRHVTEQQPSGAPEPDVTATEPPEQSDPSEPSKAAEQSEQSEGAEQSEPSEGAEPPAAEPAAAAVNPQELFGSLSLTAIEADIDRLMNDKMSQLDGMLAGLEELVQKLEGEITSLETPPDDTPTP